MTFLISVGFGLSLMPKLRQSLTDQAILHQS